MDSGVFALAFYLLASSITIVFLLLNAVVTRAFNLEFSRPMLMTVSMMGTYAAFIFSQTSYFANVTHFMAPDEVMYPAHMGRIIVLSWLSACTIPAIIFLTAPSKSVPSWIIGSILGGSVVMYFCAPYFME